MANQNQSVVRVLSFSPGIAVTGWSIIDYNTTNDKLVVYRFGSLKPANTAGKKLHSAEIEKYGKQLVSLQLLRDAVSDLVGTYHPLYIIVDDTPLDPRNPSAYVALVNWFCAIQLLCYNDFDTPIIRVHASSESEGMTHQPIYDQIHDNKMIHFKQKKQAAILSHSEATSIHCGYYFLRDHYPSIVASGDILTET